MTKKLYKVFIINLLEDKDKKEVMIKEMEKIGIKDYQFFPAIDGRIYSYTKKEYDEELALKTGYKGKKAVPKGDIGCFLSHKKLYEKLLKDNETDYYLILEDDIFFKNKNFLLKLEKIVKKNKKKEKWEYLQFDYFVALNDVLKIKNYFSFVLSYLKNFIAIRHYFKYTWVQFTYWRKEKKKTSEKLFFKTIFYFFCVIFFFLFENARAVLVRLIPMRIFKPSFRIFSGACYILNKKGCKKVLAVLKYYIRDLDNVQNIASKDKNLLLKLRYFYPQIVYQNQKWKSSRNSRR